MFRLDLGSSGRYCDGVAPQLPATRRRRHGERRAAELLRAKAASPATSKNTSVILIWLDGGPGHMDMYDMKPDAPAEYRGIWRPIRTRVPGFDVTELFPKQAKVTDKFSMVRSLHHDTGDHFAGGHRMLTTKDMGVSGANTPQKFPGIGAIVDREVGPRDPGMPGYVAVPHAASIGLVPGYFGGHMLGAQHDPFVTRRPERGELPGAEPEPRRRADAGEAGGSPHAAAALRQDPHGLDAPGTAGRWTGSAARRIEFVTGPVARGRVRHLQGGRAAPRPLRPQQLGPVHAAGPAAGGGRLDVRHRPLRRLGSPLGPEEGLRELPAARWTRPVATLFEDLDDRGLLDTTLVVLCGEFGRTPKMNDGGNGGPPMSQGHARAATTGATRCSA